MCNLDITESLIRTFSRSDFVLNHVGPYLQNYTVGQSFRFLSVTMNITIKGRKRGRRLNWIFSFITDHRETHGSDWQRW